MDTDQADVDLIEKYINGKLTPGEAYSFEFRLGEDREFARKYRLRKTFPEIMHEADDVEPVKTEVTVPAIKPEREQSGILKPGYLLWLAIAVIIAGVFVFFVVIKPNRPVEKTGSMRTIPLTDSTSTPPVKQSEKTAERTGMASAIKTPVELKKPIDGMIFNRKDEILFSWILETDTFTNFYIFSEINDKLVWWRGIKPGIRENKVAALNFLPGRFYWFVGTKEVKRTFTIIN